LTDTLTFNAGLRYDHYRGDVSEGQVSPRASLVWIPTNATTLHLGYARNFTPPPLALIGGGLVAAYLLEPLFAAVGLIYAITTWVYTIWLKHQVILDVFVLSSGFVLRAMGGALVISVPISPWLYLCTSLGALFLGLIKRRHELTLMEGGAATVRPILEQYNLKLVDEMVAVVTPSTVIAYSLYTFTAPGLPTNHAMMLTIPFVLYGVFRYLYLVHVRNLGGSPDEVLLNDKPLLIDVVLWAATAAGILITFR
ncbi:MAG: TonB-dependent receptor, partial [Chloroflexi bacterium]|nr:TonB-dependent receptor [Chloroflexota bacterium]